MTGFIRGLFGSKKNETDAGSSARPKPTGTYYLSSDDAKTYGDIDYMRTAKTVKRTFPKGDARIRSISSDQEKSVTESVPKSIPSPQAQSFRPSAPPLKSSAPPTGAADRRKPDNNMDMFRNMAKDIRKK
ncbi:MAG: hypothetical protein WBA10_21105 [Elainellaceae cyanobacterium]